MPKIETIMVKIEYLNAEGEPRTMITSTDEISRQISVLVNQGATNMFMSKLQDDK